MKITKAHKLIPLLTQKDALKKLLVKFSQDENIDKELLKKEFKIEPFEKKYLLFSGNVDCEYSCAVGFDREEEYLATETQQKLINGHWEKVPVTVNKKRTVTDWTPHSGRKSDTHRVILNANAELDAEALEASDIISELSSEEVDYDTELNENILSTGAQDLLNSFATHIHLFLLPGDRSRNYNASGNATVEEVKVFLMTFYKISYMHNGKERCIEINACKNDFSITLEEDERDNLKYEPLDTKKIASDKFQKLAKIRNICWLTVIPITIVSGFISWFFLLFVAAVATSIVLTVKHHKLYSAYKKELDDKEMKKRNSILDVKRKEVYAVLCEAILNNELAPCTFEEVYSC